MRTNEGGGEPNHLRIQIRKPKPTKQTNQLRNKHFSNENSSHFNEIQIQPYERAAIIHLQKTSIRKTDIKPDVKKISYKNKLYILN